MRGTLKDSDLGQIPLSISSSCEIRRPDTAARPACARARRTRASISSWVDFRFIVLSADSMIINLPMPFLRLLVPPGRVANRGFDGLEIPK